MTATMSTVQASRPEALLIAAARLRASNASLDATITREQEVLAQLAASWEGLAADAALAKGLRDLQREIETLARLEAMQHALKTGGADLATLRMQILATAVMAWALGASVGDDGTVTAPFFSIVMTPLVAMGITAILHRLLAHFDAVDRFTADAIRAADPAGSEATAPAGWTSEIPAPDTAPEDVDRWWNSLGDHRRGELMARHPGLLGNLNGILVEDRDDANRRVMRQDLHRISDAAAARQVSITEVLDHPERFGLTADDVTRYGNAGRVLDGLYRSAAVDENGTPAKVYLLKYDPLAFGGKGSAAIAIGNPDTAKNTTVRVTGMTTSVSGGTLAEPDGATLYEEANRADWDDDTAVVTWVGYDAPDDAAAASPAMAREGAALLARDVNALNVTHRGEPSHVTVIGHSYGSTMVSDAAAGYGMRVDDVVLIGCPGTDLATSVADFHLPPDGHLYVGAASTDPVTHFGEGQLPLPDGALGLGADPADGDFGAIRFKAESTTWSLNPFGDHSLYYERDSESLYNISDIVSGHGDALARNGMIAGHRMEIPVTFPLPGEIIDEVDPELFRVGTSGHVHTGPGG